MASFAATVPCAVAAAGVQLITSAVCAAPARQRSAESVPARQPASSRLFGASKRSDFFGVRAAADSRPVFRPVSVPTISMSLKEEDVSGEETSEARSKLAGAAIAVAGVAGIAAFGVMTQSESAEAIDRATLTKQLSEVPVFTIVDASNKPIVASNWGEEKGRFVVFYFSRKDAMAALPKARAGQPGKNLKVMTVGLDKAYKLTKDAEAAAKSGAAVDAGSDAGIQARYVPVAKQIKNAVDVLKTQGRKVTHFNGTPIYQAEGLTMRQGNDTRQFIPLFFTKEDLEAAWAEMRRGNPAMSPQPRIEVGAFEELMKRMEDTDSPEWQRVVFFAPKESLDFVGQPRW
eukprot:tig00021319_g20238.t1